MLQNARCNRLRYRQGRRPLRAARFGCIVAQGGLGNFDPSVIGFRPDGTKFNVYPLYPRVPLPFGSEGFEMYGPVGGLVCHKGRIYVSHRDRNGFGVITAFDYYGGHRTVVSGLPA